MDQTNATPATASEQSNQEPVKEQPQQFGAWQKIVIVEDNNSLADIYKIRLELLGYKCFVAYDGQEALKLIEQELPDLVLLDLMVPKIAGDQILATMRASEWGKHIKVQIISNLNEVDAPAGLREQGIEGYTVKANLSNDQLDILVDNILKPAGQQENVVLGVDEAKPETTDVIAKATENTSTRSATVVDTPVIPVQQPPIVSPLFTGVKSVIYPSSDLDADKEFWKKVTGLYPYFDQPYYVGFSINGCELGLDPNAAKEGITDPIAYWHVTSTTDAIKTLVDAGSTVNSEPKDVGGGMMMATFKDLSGNVYGIIDDATVSGPQED